MREKIIVNFLTEQSYFDKCLFFVINNSFVEIFHGKLDPKRLSYDNFS